MTRANYKLSDGGMVDSLRRLRHARAVRRAVERRMQVHRESATDKPADVLARLRANQNVRAAVARLIDGGPHE
jgi:hypothetical protein